VGYYADKGQILGDAGHGLFDLAFADDDEIQAQATISRLDAAYTIYPAEIVRSRALTMIRIASLKALHQDIGEALDAAEIAVADARQVQSHRVTDDLRVLDTVLGRTATRRRADDRVANVRASIAALVSAAA